MGPYRSAAELAEETDTSTERIGWLERIGTLRPTAPGRFVPGDVFRVRMISALLDAGFTRGEVVWAASEGALDLDHVDAYPLTDGTAKSTRSFGEFATSSGLATEGLAEIFRTFGLPEPDPDASLRDDEEAMLADFMNIWSLAADADAPRRAARLIGDGTRLAAVGWSDLFGEEVAGAARQRFLTGEISTYPPEIVDAAATMMHLLPSMMAWLERRYIQQAAVAGIVENFEALLALSGLPRAPGRPTQPAVVFVDMTGFTELTERRGDDVAVSSAASLQLRAEAVATAKGGRLVKLLGDGAMLYFREADAAVEAALEFTRTFVRDHGISVHVGVHTGPVVERDRDVFGRTVNLASRIADMAGPDEAIVSEAVVRAVDADRFHFQPVGAVDVKGVPEPIPLFRIET